MAKTTERTFKIPDKPPLMKGDDVRSWQGTVRAMFRTMNINCPIEPDGVYGVQTRTFSHDLLKALGLRANYEMENGLTRDTRRRVRLENFTADEASRRRSADITAFRRNLRERWREKKVHSPVTQILADSWGYHPPVHDGLDVITNADPVIFAMVKSKVIDVRSGGWWGKAPSGDVAKGDGIIQLQVLEDVGPFKKGMVIGYGHAEKALVKEGDVVRAGAPIGHAGLAVAWHIHLMVNDGKQGGRGVGTTDPRPFLDYAVKNG